MLIFDVSKEIKTTLKNKIMTTLTKSEFRQLKRQELSKHNDYLRNANERQINDFCNMIDRDLKSKYVII